MLVESIKVLQLPPFCPQPKCMPQHELLFVNADIPIASPPQLECAHFALDIGVDRTMDVVKMQAQIVELTNSLFQEGFVDEQFVQLQQLQDESNPDFVAEVVGLYFEDSERLLEELTKALAQELVDFKVVDAFVHQFKGSSSSIGVQRVKNVCITFRNLCEARNVEGSRQALQHLKQECLLVKNKLQNLFELEQRLLEAGGTIPMFE